MHGTGFQVCPYFYIGLGMKGRKASAVTATKLQRDPAQIITKYLPSTAH